MANVQGVEAFFEFNRTGYPDIFTVSLNSTIGDRFPKRLLFPASEYERNPGNVPDLVEIQVPVWWDVD